MIVGVQQIAYTLYMDNTQKKRDEEAKFWKKKQHKLKTNDIIADCIKLQKQMAYEIHCRELFYNKNIQQMYTMYPDIPESDLDELVYKLYMVENNWSLEIDVD